MGKTKLDGRVDDLDMGMRELRVIVLGMMQKTEEQEKKILELEGTMKEFKEEMLCWLENGQREAEKLANETEVVQKGSMVVEVGQKSRQIAQEEDFAGKEIDDAEKPIDAEVAHRGRNSEVEMARKSVVVDVAHSNLGLGFEIKPKLIGKLQDQDLGFMGQQWHSQQKVESRPKLEVNLGRRDLGFVGQQWRPQLKEESLPIWVGKQDCKKLGFADLVGILGKEEEGEVQGFVDWNEGFHLAVFKSNKKGNDISL